MKKQNVFTAESTFRPSKTSDLRIIAHLCPFTDGNAVYIARGLLAPIDSTEYENSCEGEEEGDEENGKRIANPYVQQTDSFNFHLYPNPNNGEIKIDYSLNEGEMGQMNIYATTGQLVKTVYFIPGLNQMNVSLSELEAGLYLYDLKINGELKEGDRIIIIR
jgi:putative ubiquitin-RnfH superfamily antitoxin RatB of RatAB toxin-antitoxin module